MDRIEENKKLLEEVYNEIEGAFMTNDITQIIILADISKSLAIIAHHYEPIGKLDERFENCQTCANNSRFRTAREQAKDGIICGWACLTCEEASNYRRLGENNC